MRPACLLCGVLVAGLTAPAAAQDGPLEWGFNVGHTMSSGWPTSRVRSTRLSLLEIEAAIRGRSERTWRVEYPVTLVLHARLANTALGPAMAYPSLGRWMVPDSAGRATATGMGIRPLGVRVLRSLGHVELSAEAGVGGLLFDIPAPASNTARFNFTADVGLGLRVRVPRGHVNFGYRIHHLSNGGRGAVNPAVDSHMLLVGLSLH